MEITINVIKEDSTWGSDTYKIHEGEFYAWFTRYMDTYYPTGITKDDEGNIYIWMLKIK